MYTKIKMLKTSLTFTHKFSFITAPIDITLFLTPPQLYTWKMTKEKLQCHKIEVHLVRPPVKKHATSQALIALNQISSKHLYDPKFIPTYIQIYKTRANQICIREVLAKLEIRFNIS